MSRDHAAVFLGDFFQIDPGPGDRIWTVSIAIEPSVVGRILTEVGTPPRAVKYEASRAAAPSVLVIACPRPRGADPEGHVVVDALALALLAQSERAPIPLTDGIRRLSARLSDLPGQTGSIAP